MPFLSIDKSSMLKPALALAIGLSSAHCAMAGTEEREWNDCRVPQEIRISGGPSKAGQPAYTVRRHEVYGGVEEERPLNPEMSLEHGPGHVQNIAPTGSGCASSSDKTRWFAATLSAKNALSKGFINHIALLGRSQFGPSDYKTCPTYNGRGIIFWPGGTPDGYPGAAHSVQPERFLEDGHAGNGEQCADVHPGGALGQWKPLELVDGREYDIVMHITLDGVAYWIVDLDSGRVLASDWWPDPRGRLTGAGFAFGFYCHADKVLDKQPQGVESPMLDPACNYRAPVSPLNQPFEVKLSNIQMGWF